MFQIILEGTLTLPGGREIRSGSGVPEARHQGPDLPPEAICRRSKGVFSENEYRIAFAE